MTQFWLSIAAQSAMAGMILMMLISVAVSVVNETNLT